MNELTIGDYWIDGDGDLLQVWGELGGKVVLTAQEIEQAPPQMRLCLEVAGVIAPPDETAVCEGWDDGSYHSGDMAGYVELLQVERDTAVKALKGLLTMEKIGHTNVIVTTIDPARVRAALDAIHQITGEWYDSQGWYNPLDGQPGIVTQVTGEVQP